MKIPILIKDDNNGHIQVLLVLHKTYVPSIKMHSHSTSHDEVGICFYSPRPTMFTFLSTTSLGQPLDIMVVRWEMVAMGTHI